VAPVPPCHGSVVAVQLEGRVFRGHVQGTYLPSWGTRLPSCRPVAARRRPVRCGQSRLRGGGDRRAPGQRMPVAIRRTLGVARSP
jgi:hypothetical protein